MSARVFVGPDADAALLREVNRVAPADGLYVILVGRYWLPADLLTARGVEVIAGGKRGLTAALEQLDAAYFGRAVWRRLVVAFSTDATRDIVLMPSLRRLLLDAPRYGATVFVASAVDYNALGRLT